MRPVFVFGFFSMSSGKTVVSTALCRGLFREGVRVAPFKPRSGHNLWFQRDAFNRCMEEGRLFCEDIIKLREAARCRLPYEVLNPVDALMAPLDAAAFLRRDYVRGMYLEHENPFHHLLVERYTMWEGGRAKSFVCVNERNVRGGSWVDEGYIRRLTGSAEEVWAIEDVNGWASIFGRLGPTSISTCFRRVAGEHELVVVEGFNDAVCPAPELVYGAVLGVAPGAVAFYDPDDFGRVIEVKSMTGGEPMALRSEDVVQFIKPEEILSIPALESGGLADFDVLSERLGNIVDAVLDRIE